MASARSPLPLVFLVIALPSILAAPATTLFDLNKLGIHGISAISGNCAGASLTPESYLYCAIKDKTFEGEVGIDIRIGTGYLQRVSANPMPFALPDPVDNAPASERFSFPASGKDYNVIFLDRDILRVYAAPDATAAATTILTTMLDETYPAAVNPACQIQVSTDARAVAFKNCVPKTPPVQNARADANTRQSNADGTHASTEGTNAESVAETSGRLTDAPSTDDTPTGLRYGLLSESLLPSAEIQERCRFIPPLKNPEITSEFGTPRQYNGRSYSHDGIDIVGNPTIIAPADGKIVSVFGAHEGGACGNGMSMEFTGCSATMGKPIYGTFCHLQDVPSLKVGQAVKQGQTLGTMGGTGSANGAVHLHYGVRIGCVEASCAVNPKPYLANGYAPRVLAAKDALLEFAGKTASQETMEFAETQTQKTRIVAIKSNPGSCPQDASFQTLPDFSGGNKACVYFYVDQKDGAKDAFFDVAFSGYGNDKGGCFAARAVLHKPGVQYPEQYRNLPAGTTPVYIQALSERPNYAGFYYVEVPIRQNFGNAVNGLVLNMYLSDATTDFSKYTEKEGISRKPRTDQKIAGKLTCQTFSTQTATAASLQGKKFVIDAGHGTPYSEGQGSYVGANPQEATLHEHQVTLKVAERLVEQLKQRGAVAVMTRSSEADVSLSKRAGIANAQQPKPDAFVSLHVNCDRIKAVKEMAQIGGQFAGIGLQDHRLCSAGVIYPDTKDGRSEQSKTLAQTIAKTMGLDVLLEKEGKGVYPDGAASAFVGTYVTGKPYKPITLGVLRNTQMPAVLVEMGSIDEPAIATEARQQQLAEQIAEGLAQAYGAMASTPTSSVDRPDPNRVTLEACIQQLKREAKGKPGPQLYRKLTLTAAAQFGINPGYYQKQIEIESGFDPNARSKAGAQGIAQFMPDTARSVGLANPFDPLPALCAGAKHMAQVYQSSAKKAYCKGKEYACALASYNAGFGAVEKYRGIPPYDETQKYVANIMGTSRSARAG